MIATLFITSHAILRQRLKLTGAVDTDVAAVIDNAIRQVRVGILRRLGSIRVSEIVTYTSTDTPATENELTRARAEECELAWTRMILMRELPQLYIDNQSDAKDRWNEEKFTRDLNTRDIEVECSRLARIVEGILCELEGGNCSTEINVATIGPECKNKSPDHSIKLNVQ